MSIKYLRADVISDKLSSGLCSRLLMGELQSGVCLQTLDSQLQYSKSRVRDPSPSKGESRLEIGDVGFIHPDNGHFVRVIPAQPTGLRDQLPENYDTIPDIALSDLMLSSPTRKDLVMHTKTVEKLQADAALK
jgi:hypothetical protein